MNFTNFFNLTQVKALFGNSINIITPQIDTSTVASPTPIGTNKRMGDQRKIFPGKECWVSPFPPQKKPSRYTHFRNQTYIKNQEEEQEAKSNFCPKCKTKTSSTRMSIKQNPSMLYLHAASCFSLGDQDGFYQDRGNHWNSLSKDSSSF